LLIEAVEEVDLEAREEEFVFNVRYVVGVFSIREDILYISM
jgi:hypothetical protein